MSNILDYYINLPKDLTQVEIISKTFINFYLYFRRLHSKKIIPDKTLKFLDSSLAFSEPLTEDQNSTKVYLESKQFQLEQFLTGFKPKYEKIEKNLKATFDIPNNYSYEEVCNLIKQSYFAYASLRYRHNLANTEMYEETVPTDKKFYKLPKYIPDTNVNVSEVLELASGIKLLSLDGTTYELFNIFNDNLNIRTIVDTTDGQIIAIFVNGEEYTDISQKFIKKLKKQIKKSSSRSNNK